jgi:hypothetical protein
MVQPRTGLLSFHQFYSLSMNDELIDDSPRSLKELSSGSSKSSGKLLRTLRRTERKTGKGIGGCWQRINKIPSDKTYIRTQPPRYPEDWVLDKPAEGFDIWQYRPGNEGSRDPNGTIIPINSQ